MDIGLHLMDMVLHMSCFCYRSQCTRYKSSLSEFKQVTCGVPQGSLLGPLLFILYVHDIHKPTKLLSFLFYADNTNILYYDKNFDSLFNVVNENLLKVCDSFKAKSLTVHSNKCNYIVFSKKLKCTDSMTANVRINPHSILRV